MEYIVKKTAYTPKTMAVLMLISGSSSEVVRKTNVHRTSNAPKIRRGRRQFLSAAKSAFRIKSGRSRRMLRPRNMNPEKTSMFWRKGSSKKVKYAQIAASKEAAHNNPRGRIA